MGLDPSCTHTTTLSTRVCIQGNALLHSADEARACAHLHAVLVLGCQVHHLVLHLLIHLAQQLLCKLLPGHCCLMLLLQTSIGMDSSAMQEMCQRQPFVCVSPHLAQQLCCQLAQYQRRREAIGQQLVQLAPHLHNRQKLGLHMVHAVCHLHLLRLSACRLGIAA